MTMMTPLGQGCRMYSRHRRWPKIVFVIVVVLAVVGGIGFGVWTWLNGRNSAEGPTATPSPSCSTPKAKPPKDIPPPAKVSVDVSNGTDESGLAISTADELSKRGFDVQGIGNTNRPVKDGVALVRYPAKNLGSAIRVAAYIENAELVEVKGKSSQPVDTTIELWLGPDFDRVLPPDEADVASVDIPSKPPICK